jgi:hypothetical protein
MSASLARRTFWRGTYVGTLGSPARPRVGTAGWVQVEPGWDLGWWVGAEDRWHLPEHEVAVRQRLLSEGPVVETAMRIPGGDAVQRVFAVAGSAELGPMLVIEVENQSAVPVAVALVVRGLADRLQVAADAGEADGAVVRFEHVAGGRSAGGRTDDTVNEHHLLFDRPAAQTAFGRGLGVFIFPVSHTGTLRVAIPLELDRETAPDHARVLSSMPTALSVAKGWEAQGGRGVRVELPDPVLSATLDAARRQLLLAELGDGALVGEVERDWVTARSVLRAFDRLGFSPEAERLLLTLPDHLGTAGAVDAAERVDTAGAALVAVAHHVDVMGDDDLAGGLVEVVAAVAQGLRKRAVPAKRLGRVGPLPTPASGDPWAAEPSWWTWWWSLAGLEAAARLFDRAGQAAAARDARADADLLRSVIEPLLVADLERTGGVLPASPGGALDGTAAGNLWAGAGLPDADISSWWEPTRRWIGGDAADGYGRVLLPSDAEGMRRPLLTAVLAGADVRAGDPNGIARLSTLAAEAGGLRVWPEVHDPRTGAAGKGASPDLRVTAAVVDAVLDLLVHPVTEGLVLVPHLPGDWLGQGIEAHEAPTPHGRFSFAVRWHGERPAILWQLDRPAGAPPVHLTAPGLDATWSSDDSKGETLLSPIPSHRSSSLPLTPPLPPPPEGGSFS